VTNLSRTDGPLTVRRFLQNLGPGLITGAADSDPSGISTYSIAGAAFGYSVLWTALITLPLMATIQLMCARLGMVTGRGLGSLIRKRYPPIVVWSACALLAVANVFNIAADLGGMGEAMQMVTGVTRYLWTPLLTAAIIALLLMTSYKTMARYLKWLAVVLFAYVVAAFLARPDWRAAVHNTLIPHIQWSDRYVSTLVAILGTTISPYLFFWQTAEEVEEEREHGRTTVKKRRGASKQELTDATSDVMAGTVLSNIVMYFIMLTAAATLNAYGTHEIQSAREAARALLPLAGEGAYWLFTIGLVGTGMLAVPVLAGSCAYAIAEAATWRKASLNEIPGRAPRFYAVIAVALMVGLALDFAGLNAVKMLFWSAILNGILAPPLVVLVVLLSSDREVMGDNVNSPLAKALGWLCAVLMAAAAVAMFVL
jgi:NRAMP (natural resistance-associated macrophage protein)-like metal ion transporter